MTVQELRRAIAKHVGPVMVFPSGNSDWLLPPFKVVKADVLAYLDEAIEAGDGDFPAPWGIHESTHRGPLVLDYN